MQSSALHQGHSTSCANGREELAASAVLEINQAGTVVRGNQVSANLHCKVNEMWGAHLGGPSDGLLPGEQHLCDISVNLSSGKEQRKPYWFAISPSNMSAPGQPLGARRRWFDL